MSVVRERARRAVSNATRELRNGEESLAEGDYTGALKYFQEAGEYAAKAVLLALTADYPKVHQVGRFLLEHKGRLPRWFIVGLDKYAEAVDELGRGRLRFRYPYEHLPEAHEELAKRMAPVVKEFIDKVERLISKGFST